MVNFSKALGANIFKLMQVRGLKKEDIANKLNFSYQDVCKIIEGELIISPKDLDNIAKILGTTKKDILATINSNK